MNKRNVKLLIKFKYSLAIDFSDDDGKKKKKKGGKHQEQ